MKTCSNPFSSISICKILMSLWIIVASISLNSCNSGDDSPIDSDPSSPSSDGFTMTISPDTLHLAADGKTQGTFTVSLSKVSSFYAKADMEWCKLSDADGYGKTSYTVKVDPASNTDTKKRLAKISFHSGDVTQHAYVLQEASKNEIGGIAGTAVDLGLSVKWSSHNLGAFSQEEIGAYLAWGELTTKKNYSEDEYQHYDYDNATYKNIGKNISGTKYDAAVKYWGNGWRMPTYAEFKELINKCKWKWTRVNDIKGYKVTGPNGKSIFLPAGGRMYYITLNNKDLDVDLWTGTLSEKNIHDAYGFSGDLDSRNIWQRMRHMGCPIRPVTK